MLKVLSENQKIRSSILLCAAAIILLSFTFLHESQSKQLETVTRSTRTLLGSCLARYQISDEDLDED